jgi:hypothetical protein
MTLYYGPPGIALFYIQMARSSSSPVHSKMAIQAGQRMLSYLDLALESFGNNTALYYGISGIAFAFRELATFVLASGNQKALAVSFINAAHKVEDSLLKLAKDVPAGGITWSNNTDIAHGASGTMLYLLHAAAAENRTEQVGRRKGSNRGAVLTKLAVQAGEWLLTMAVPVPIPAPSPSFAKAKNTVSQAVSNAALSSGVGYKWPRGPDSDGAHTNEFFPNFCCGTAGVAYTLASVYQISGDTRFLDAAVKGANYLLSIAKRTNTTRSDGTRSSANRNSNGHFEDEGGGEVEDEGILIFHDEPAHEGLYYLGWWVYYLLNIPKHLLTLKQN